MRSPRGVDIYSCKSLPLPTASCSNQNSLAGRVFRRHRYF